MSYEIFEILAFSKPRLSKFCERNLYFCERNFDFCNNFFAVVLILVMTVAVGNHRHRFFPRFFILPYEGG